MNASSRIKLELAARAVNYPRMVQRKLLRLGITFTRRSSEACRANLLAGGLALCLLFLKK